MGEHDTQTASEPARSTGPPAGPVLLLCADRMLGALMAAQLSRLGVERVEQASSVPHARVIAQATGPLPLAIIDLDLPGDDSLRLIEELRPTGSSRIVTLTTDPAMVGWALRSGARACLFQAARPAHPRATTTELPARHQSSSGTEPTGAGEVLDIHGQPQILSAREISVLQLTADGHTNTKIAETLQLSTLTVKSHLSRIGGRLGTGERAHTVLLALRAGVIH